MGKHSRNPGDDFDAQFNRSKARGDQKREQGRGIYSADRYLKDAGQVKQPKSNDEGCGKATVVLLSLLGGAAWGLSEVVSRLA